MVCPVSVYTNIKLPYCIHKPTSKSIVMVAAVVVAVVVVISCFPFLYTLQPALCYALVIIHAHTNI
jgi:hypothetical protein